MDPEALPIRDRASIELFPNGYIALEFRGNMENENGRHWKLGTYGMDGRG